MASCSWSALSTPTAVPTVRPPQRISIRCRSGQCWREPARGVSGELRNPRGFEEGTLIDPFPTGRIFRQRPHTADRAGEKPVQEVRRAQRHAQPEDDASDHAFAPALSESKYQSSDDNRDQGQPVGRAGRVKTVRKTCTAFSQGLTPRATSSTSGARMMATTAIHTTRRASRNFQHASAATEYVIGVFMNDLVPTAPQPAEVPSGGWAGGFPAILERAGASACLAAEEFFSARISNPHTHRAYGRTIRRFLAPSPTPAPASAPLRAWPCAISGITASTVRCGFRRKGGRNGRSQFAMTSTSGSRNTSPRPALPTIRRTPRFSRRLVPPPRRPGPRHRRPDDPFHAQAASSAMSAYPTSSARTRSA